MPKVSTNISLDLDLKKSAQELFADFGLDMTTAITIFLRQCLREQRIPFEIRRDSPKRKTLEAMQEALAISRDDNVKSYSNFDELKKALEED